MQRTPNFLLFITDQHRADHLGCYGNGIVRTPHIDSLAARGIRFERFYVATPVCMPNRSTLMTGRMPSLHGARHNGIPLSLDATTFTDVLREAGYRTGLVGKCHLQNISGKEIIQGLPEHDPSLTQPAEGLREARRAARPPGRYDQELPATWTNEPNFEPDLPFYGFDHVALAIGHGDEMNGHYARWLAERCDNTARGRDNALPGESGAPQAWRTRLSEELYPTTFVAEETIAFLEARAAARDGRPFFLQCSFPDPHHPFTPPGRYWDMYDPAEIPTPHAFRHPEDSRPPHLAALHAARADGKANPQGHTVFAVDENEARAAIALNYGSITMIDDAIGRVLRRLADLGLAEDTVVVFTTDHGDFMGDHGLLLKGALHYQGLIRVPCIWADPADKARRSTDVLCGTLDLAPSILVRAGIAPFNGMQGKSLPSMAAGNRGHDAIVVEEHQRRSYMGFPPNFLARTLVTGRWRLTLYSCAEWGELYDLQDDPHEFFNLWDAPRHKELKAALTEQLLRQMMELSEGSPLATGHGP